jgi:hypothetical protein
LSVGRLAALATDPKLSHTEALQKSMLTIAFGPAAKAVVIGLDCVAEQPSVCGGFRRFSTR